MKTYKLPHFKEFTRQHFPNSLPKGNYNNIPISLIFNEFSEFENNFHIISNFLKNLKLVFINIEKYLIENPSRIGEFYSQNSNELKSYLKFIKNIKPEEISIYFYDELSFLIYFKINGKEICATIFNDLSFNYIDIAWGGFSIEKSKTITYPPEKLNEFKCNTYEYIDNLNFLINPFNCIEDAGKYLEIAKNIFLKEGWNGDGPIELLWIPPFMLKDEFGETVYMEHTEGVIFWHVKQLSDGISFLLFPKDLEQQIFGYGSYREPIIIEKLGKINERDAIYLDNIKFNGNSLVLNGIIEGALCENVKNDKGIPYEISFKNVLNFTSTEIDFYDFRRMRSNFEICVKSKKISNFKKKNNSKLTKKHQHFVFYTYDLVFEIIASDYELKL